MFGNFAFYAFTECGVLDVQTVATHSGKRMGVQQYDALGNVDEWVRDKGEWETSAAFINYEAVCNRIEMHFVMCSPKHGPLVS